MLQCKSCTVFNSELLQGHDDVMECVWNRNKSVVEVRLSENRGKINRPSTAVSIHHIFPTSDVAFVSILFVALYFYYCFYYRYKHGTVPLHLICYYDR